MESATLQTFKQVGLHHKEAGKKEGEMSSPVVDRPTATITDGRTYLRDLTNEVSETALEVLRDMEIGEKMSRKKFARMISPYDSPTAIKVIDDLEDLGWVTITHDCKEILRMH